MANEYPEVYVGVVTCNSRADLPRCLAALQEQTYPHIRVTIVDNASRDGTVAWLRSNCPDIQLIANTQNVGYARAHNQIIRLNELTAEDCYLPLNPDVALTPSYVAELVALLRRTGAGHVGGKLLYLSPKGTPSNVIYSAGHALLRSGYAFNIGQGIVDTGQFDGEREVFGAPGAAPLIGGRLIASLGSEFFDEQMFLYGEDVDVDWRARRQGWRCFYTSAAVAYHLGSHADATLRVEAIGNRYLSAIKNATLYDLISYNLPIILAHNALRLMVTPRLGWQLARKLWRQAPAAWRRRQPCAVPRSEMLVWFRWGERQPTSSPVTWRQRLRAFLRHTLRT